MRALTWASSARIWRKRGNGGLYLPGLVDDLLALQAGEALQPHVQDGLGLNLGKGVALRVSSRVTPGGAQDELPGHQLLFGLRRVAAARIMVDDLRPGSPGR